MSRWLVEPVWRDETVVCIAGGPSLTQGQVDYCRGKARVAVVNDSVGNAPWADLLYACDAKWWAQPEKRRLHEPFEGIKVSLEDTGLSGVFRVEQAGQKTGLCLEPGRVVTGGNSGYQLINVVVQLGVSRIVLLGYDMKPGPMGRSHHHADHSAPLKNPNARVLAGFRDAFASLAEPLRSQGVGIVNCTSDTDLTCFPRRDLHEVLL